MDLFKTFHNPEARVGSSAFDLSAKHVFSAKAGQCVPAYVVDTVPGDKYEIDLAALMRSNTLDTAAFVRGKFNFDFFFVPYQQVWHRFMDFVSQHKDLHTSLYASYDVVASPTVSLKQLIRIIVNSHIGQTWIGFDYWYDPTFDQLRLLDQLGYGNYIYLIDLADANSWTVDDQLLASHLHKLFGGSGEVEEITTDGTVFVNLYRLCAYQHIWYDFYRNKYHDTELDSTPKDYQKMFNLDDVDCSTIAASRIPTYGPSAFLRLMGITSLRYCQWKKDIYTAVMPTQQYGVVSSVDISDVYVQNTVPVADTAAGAIVSGLTGRIYRNGTSQDKWNIPNAFDVLQLRRAEALQKWREAALRAGNMNDRNIKAHFGVDPYYYDDNNVHFIGSFDGSFQVNPIEATAQTGAAVNGNVGNLAATGTAVANGTKINFDCRDYGVLMCIARFVPESEYASTGIEKATTRFEPFDFYNPEFAHLGLEAVPMIENELSEYWLNRNFILGYAPRDYDYKQMQDKVYGYFGHRLDFAGNRSFGMFSNWVAPRVENLVSANNHVAQYRRTSSFYVDPRVFDRVFGLSATSSPSTDQFFFNAFFDVKAIRKMPILGLPEF